MSGRKPNFFWSGRPVYRCQYCGDHYERVENPEAVIQHEAEMHGNTFRESPILAPGGEPAMVAVEEQPIHDEGLRQEGRRRR